MAELRPELLVHPLFYDALSGEFTPPSDPEARAHTLGRLAYAAFSKGTEYEGRSVPGRMLYAYEPSWAPGVKATVSVDRPASRLNHLLLENNANRASLYVQSLADRFGGPTLYLASNTLRVETTFPLSLGNDLRIAHMRVTSAAQAFFEESAQ
jgi:hypothetical protein